MAENHGAPEAGKRPKVWTRGRRETKSHQRVHSWTVQSEMRGVLGRVSKGAAGRILDSANPREIRTYKKAVSVAAKTREDTASMTRERKFLGEIQGNLNVKEFR